MSVRVCVVPTKKALNMGCGKRKEKSVDAPVYVAQGGLVYFRRRYDASEQQRRYGFCHYKHQCCKKHQEVHALIEYASYSCVVALAVAAGYEYLCTYAEAEPHHEYGNIIYAGNGRGTQLYFAHTAQKCCVGHAYELLHEYAHQYGECYAQNAFAAVGRSLWLCGLHSV